MTTIRVPERVVFYMENTGWGQTKLDEINRADVEGDTARMRLRGAFDGPRNRDGSISLRDPDERLLGRLWREADHLADGLRFGDHDPDALADYNAAMLGRSLSYASASDIADSQTCVQCGRSLVGLVSHEHRQPGARILEAAHPKYGDIDSSD